MSLITIDFIELQDNIRLRSLLDMWGPLHDAVDRVIHKRHRQRGSGEFFNITGKLMCYDFENSR